MPYSNTTRPAATSTTTCTPRPAPKEIPLLPPRPRFRRMPSACVPRVIDPYPLPRSAACECGLRGVCGYLDNFVETNDWDRSLSQKFAAGNKMTLVAVSIQACPSSSSPGPRLSCLGCKACKRSVVAHTEGPVQPAPIKHALQASAVSITVPIEETSTRYAHVSRKEELSLVVLRVLYRCISLFSCPHVIQITIKTSQCRNSPTVRIRSMASRNRGETSWSGADRD